MHLIWFSLPSVVQKKKLKTPEKKDNPDVRYSDIFEKWLETRTIIIC